MSEQPGGQEIADILWRCVDEENQLFRTYTTDDEAERTVLLLREIDESDPEYVHILKEELAILRWTLTARRDVERAREAGDADAAEAAVKASEQRIRQLRAFRLALDAVGLRKATVSFSERSATIGLETRSHSQLMDKRKEFSRALKARLNRGDRVKVWFTTHYPFTPQDESADVDDSGSSDAPTAEG